MKKRLAFILLVLVLILEKSIAQAPFATMDSINTNNINAAVLVHGDLWWDPVSHQAHCNFPLNSNNNINFASSLWMSGYDGSGQLHVTAQTYRQDGNDYWPGPIDGGVSIAYDSSQKWAKIWKVNRSDIQGFQSLPLHTISNTIASILTWPGKGNVYAQGNGGAPLTINNDMAPFIDLNGNGIYEPLNGEYPDIKGEQALWWVFNDNGPSHSQTHGNPLGVVIRAMTYGYNRGTLIDNVVYYEYTITNYSPNNYNNFRMAIWDDEEVGYYLDDYIGFDSVHRMGIGYNATNDDGLPLGHPHNTYGMNPPMVGVTMIELPGDAGTSYIPAGSFMFYNNDYSIIGNPTNDTQYNYYMRSQWRDGTHLKHDPVTGSMVVGPDCNYAFTGDPSDTAGWSECAMNNSPGDRRFILASNDFTLNAGETKKIVWAIVVADSAGGCGQTNFTKIKTVADTAWYIYHNPLPPHPAGVSALSEGSIKIYPNPANDKLFIADPGNKNDKAEVVIVNTLGQKITVPFDQKEHMLDVSNLPTGVYHLLYSTPGIEKATTFLKQ